MKHSIALRCFAAVVLAGLGLIAPAPVPAATILQAPAANFVAFEAEENATLLPGITNVWAITNDVTPSGSTALFAAGTNFTVFPMSFASYAIKFSMAGSYKVYFRWRANETYTTTDQNAANSYFAPKFFNASTLASTNNTDYNGSSVNNTRVRPESNTYHVDGETSSLLAVSQAQVDAGVPLIFTIGTREAGFMLDRFVISLDTALTEAQFNAAPNSDTDVFVQPPGVNYVAFEAESPKAKLLPGITNVWAITNDVTPSGSTALFAAGTNFTVFPMSFASYAIKFSMAGSYKVYFRWRANETYTTTDQNAANSYFAPKFFNASTLASTNNTDYNGSSVNNTRVRPESNTYHVDGETSSLLVVSQAQVDAGVPLIFTIGTREAGFMLDRFVLSLDTALTEAQFNALDNTGAIIPPVITKIVADGTLTYVKVSFSKALNENLDASNFKITNGLTVLNAVLDLSTMKDVILTTSPQTPGTRYFLVVNDIYDLNDVALAPNTTTNFFAWVRAAGFTKRELYYTIGGTSVDALTNALKFPNSPEVVDVVRGLAHINLLRARNYGVRLSGLFTPTQSGIYEFFTYNNDDARLSIATNAAGGGLQTILNSPATSNMVFNAVPTGVTPISLVASQSYYIEVLLKQGDDFDVWVDVAARRQGDVTPPASLPSLSTQVSTFVDPLQATLNITMQPASVTTTNGNRARFEARATSANGPVYYQWLRNGTNIADATRAAYYTPVLGTTNTGDQYRVIIWGGGVITTSAVATVTVNAGPTPTLIPVVGINLVGGGTDGPGGILRTNDVTGVVPQGYFNNLSTGTGTSVPLVNADGTASAITATFSGTTWYTGAGEATAENLLFQGYLHNTNTGVSITLNNVPAGNYHFIAYSVGFTFNAIYDESLQLNGAITYPVFHVTAEHGIEYNAAPSIFRRMFSTNAAARDKGNFVMFTNVSPSVGGTLTLLVLNESAAANTGIGDNPALNGIQLVPVLPAVVNPALSVSRNGTNVNIAWPATASGFVLEGNSLVGVTTNWQSVVGVPNPITGAGSVLVAPTNSARFYRLRQ